MNAGTRHLAITRVVVAPKALVPGAFTDPDDLAARRGPAGDGLPRDRIDSDVRPGGHRRRTEVNAAAPGPRVHVHLDLTDVGENELIEGVMRIAGRLREGVEPSETRLRVEFHDEVDRRTRMESRPWLPGSLAAPGEQGRREAFAELDAALAGAGAARVGV
jgi:uncharacterized protein YndB with AHSA1/START domain